VPVLAETLAGGNEDTVSDMLRLLSAVVLCVVVLAAYVVSIDGLVRFIESVVAFGMKKTVCRIKICSTGRTHFETTSVSSANAIVCS
jgi:hypothetical protein